MVSGAVSKILSLSLGKFPVRLNVGVMLFLTTMINYMLRVNFSILYLAMVNTTADASDYGPRYDWNKSEQGLLLGAYFWGYLISAIPGALLAERYGGKTITTIIHLLSTILTALGPLLAGCGFVPMYMCRLLTGLFAGPQYPALHNLIAKWAPPEEKGKFIAALLGGTFGTVVTWPLMGVVIENLGWKFGFYIPAFLNGVIGIMWYFIVSNDPQSHTWISQPEKEFIEKSLGSAVSKEKPPTPFIKILTSVPYIALICLHFGNLWGMFFLMTATPKFMNETLNFNLGKAGILAALPYLGRLIFGLIFGSVGDVVRKREMLSITAMRKSFTIFSHILPGIFLASLCFVEHPYACVAIITISLAFNGSSCLTNLQNSHDLAPNFAGLLYGIMNAIGTSAGFVSPIVVAYFTEDGNEMSNWCKIFIIGAVFYITPALIFMIFGSGNIQPWNEVQKLEPEKEAEAKTEQIQEGEKNV
ncbi:sialin-like [Lutzomyia longipalpis]|uniref:sialin-like n=1 Tax=Lutzomyia longipalpis TaxID=7200 RepID=UPI00248370E4|nr:sialin-like [Lutzomyia longipalpis]